MNTSVKTQWVWEETDPRRSGSSGDIAKLFKNEGVKQPGPFAKGAPSPAATLMAREVVQNSRDAARELQEEIGDAAPDFEVDFEFRDLVGEERESLIQALDIDGLSQQLARLDATDPALRTKIGLGTDNILDRLGTGSPIRTLTITETGTTGMYGPFVQARSKLFLALISIGYTMKAEGSGGSYGYGKAGLIAGSATRTVVAYTCFRERSDDPGVTRRLLGMTYWGQHELGDDSYTGFARFGDSSDGWVKPFENEQADAVAKSLGLKVRRPEDDDLGTTFLVLDAEVEPSDLEIALARNWWPAIVEGEFLPSVRLVSADGTVQKFDVRPKKDPLLQSFIRAWELATTPQDNNVATELRKDLGKASASAGGFPLGRLGAHADLTGWSYAQLPDQDDDADDGDDDTSIANMSLVALVRGPKMVVEYLPVKVGKQPYIRGVFVADDAVDELLRQTEPKAHDAWQKKVAEEGVDVRAPKVADAVLKGIAKAIGDFQSRLKPPPPDPGDIRLPVLQQLFKDLIQGRGSGPKPPPKATPRDVSINLAQNLDVLDAKTVRLGGHADFALTDNVADSTADAEAKFAYRFLEDGSSGEHCPLKVTPPIGFSLQPDGSYRGKLTHKPTRFTFESDPYSADWSARLVIACDLVRTTVPSTAGDDEGEGAQPSHDEKSADL